MIVNGQTLDFVTGNGPLTKILLTASQKPVLDADALLVSDADPTYTAFCHAKVSVKKSSTSAKASGSIGLIMCRMSKLNSRFKLWLEHFHGVTSKYQPSYLGWRRAFEQHS